MFLFLGWRGWESGVGYWQVQGKQLELTAAETGLGPAKTHILFSPKQKDIRAG